LKPEESRLCEEARRRLIESLEAVEFLRVTPARADSRPGGQRPDFILRVTGPFGKKNIVGEFRRSGQPRFLRAGLQQLRKYLDAAKDGYGVMVAPYISPDGAEVCDRAGVGYCDLSGNCKIGFEGVYIERTGMKNAYADRARRELRSLYTPKCERLLRVLLGSPGRRWTTVPLAEAAGVSIALVSKARKALRNREWVEGGRGGFVLTEGRRLLMEWAENYRWDRNRIGRFYSRAAAAETESRIAEACARRGAGFALTGFSAAARLAPMVNDSRVFAYVADAPGAVAEDAGLKPVSSGANVVLAEPYDGGVFIGAADVDGLRVVSPYQAYVDLLALSGRGEEAAEAVLNERISGKW
jgi:hypothetical protein